MAFAVEPAVLLPMIPLSGSLLLPSCWFTWCTVNHVTHKLRPQPLMGRVESWTLSAAPVGRPSNQGFTSGSRSTTITNVENITAKRQRQSAQWTMFLTAVSSTMFTLAILIFFIRGILFYDRISQHLSDRDKIHEVRSSDLISGLLIVYCVILFFGYTSLITVSFQRLVLTYKRSRYRLSDRTVRIGRWLIGGCFVDFILAVSLIRSVSPTIVAVTAIPACICYPSFSIWIIWTFFKKTRKVARKMAGIRFSMSHRLSVDESALERTTQLLDASLRLSIITLVGVTSTLCNILLIIPGLLGAPGIVITVAVMYVPLDSCINTYSLLCTFGSESDRYYGFVFGRFHEYLLEKLTDIVIQPGSSISHES